MFWLGVPTSWGLRADDPGLPLKTSSPLHFPPLSLLTLSECTTDFPGSTRSLPKSDSAGTTKCLVPSPSEASFICRSLFKETVTHGQPCQLLHNRKGLAVGATNTCVLVSQRPRCCPAAARCLGNPAADNRGNAPLASLCHKRLQYQKVACEDIAAGW